MISCTSSGVGHTRVQGMDVVICATAGTREEGFELLRLLGMPFKER